MATLEFQGFKFTGTAAECASMAAEFQAIKASSPVQSVTTQTKVRRQLIDDDTPQPRLFERQMVERAEPPKARQAGREVLNYLQAVKDHTASGGLTGEDLVPVLGVAHAKGVGSRIGPINRALVAAGYRKIEEVYTNTRDSTGTRRWRAGPRISEAMDTFQRLSEEVNRA